MQAILRVFVMDITFSVIQLADICIKYGGILVETCKSFQNADQEISNSILLVESHWLRIAHQLNFLREISSSLDEEYARHQNKVLRVLQVHIHTALALVEGTTWKTDDTRWYRFTRRTKYAFSVKENLGKVVLSLEKWSSVYDISWYLIIKLESKHIDKALKTAQTSSRDPIFTVQSLRSALQENSDNGIEDEEGRSTVFVNRDSFHESRSIIEGSKTEIWHSVDGKMQYLTEGPTNLTTRTDACDLAKILRNVDPSVFSMLRCTGLVQSVRDGQPEFQGFQFVFAIPDHFRNAQYLRTAFESDIYSLDDRFAVAKQLARAVMFVHSSGFVHKNINPATILTFQHQESKELYLYLTGFENFRSVKETTVREGDDEWERNLYRHPARQGIRPEFEYCMQHDIYSLGVCLLELGLMTSFVTQNAKNNRPAPSPMVSIMADTTIKDIKKRGFECKRVLLKLAQEKLPQKMGRRYAETVITCLTCLDKTNNDFGNEKELQDENGILVGVRYIEKILTKLLDINI